jgi:mono/diheme cytochrome c family protein
MARSRTTKTIAKRIDLGYFKLPHPMRTIRRILVVGVLLIAVAWVMGASFRPRGGKMRMVDFIHLPGPVTSAHANFQNDCRQCHAGSADGSFARTVTDTACVRCHEAPAHNPNQLSFVSVDKHAAANCTACHVEHRGREAMVGASVAHCVQCHADLPAHTSNKNLEIAASITGFSPKTHPNFGNALKGDDGKWTDRTVVKFNHKKHLPMKGIENNCVACHTTADPQPGAKAVAVSDVPPWTNDKSRPSDALASTDARYMQPVSYDKHCIGCHQLDLPAGAPRLGHEEMKVVRAQIASLPAAYLANLLTDPDREQKLTVTTKEGRPPRVRTVTKRLGEAEYLDKQLQDLLTAVNKAAASDARFADLKKSLATTQPTTQPAIGLALTDAALVEHFAAFTSANSCNLCHALQGEPPALLATRLASEPAKHGAQTAPASAHPGTDQLLHTIPTGIPATPRRWFTNSQFDHAAHRNVACISCHKQALDSTLTSDVLLNTPGPASCIECHHEENRISPGAPVNCVTCHQFHDRTLAKRPPVVATGP